MDFVKIQNEYEWVLKVLDSSITTEHLEVSQKLFNNFIHKWIDELSEERIEKFNWNFQKYKSQKKVRVFKLTLI